MLLLQMARTRNPRWNPKYWALVILLFIAVLVAFSRCTSCVKEKVLTEKEREAYERYIDSVRIRNFIIDAENKELKSRKPKHDTVYIRINNKVKNEFKKIDNFDSLERVKWIQEFERANTPNQ